MCVYYMNVGVGVFASACVILCVHVRRVVCVYVCVCGFAGALAWACVALVIHHANRMLHVLSPASSLAPTHFFDITL
jgi:hypothetical protein